MSNLQGQTGDLQFTIEITRADTGKTETYELVGHIDPDQINKLTEDHENGSDTLNSSQKCGN